MKFLPFVFLIAISLKAQAQVIVNSETVCVGVTTTTLTATGATTYSWSTGATTNAIVVSPSSTTSYTVTGDGNPSNKAIGSVTVGPIATASQYSQTICSYTSTNIDLFSNIGSTTFSWVTSYINTNDPGSGSGSTIAESFASSDGTNQGFVTFTVTAESGSCTGDPIVINVTVLPAPAVTQGPDETICSGGATNITLTSNLPGTTYNWTVAPAGVTGASSGTNVPDPTTVIQTLTSVGGGSVQYSFTPTANGCAGFSQGTRVTVKRVPSISSSPSKTICSGTSVNLILTSSMSPSTYSWIAANNVNTTGESTTIQSAGTINDIITNNTASAQIVTYTVIATSGGCTGIPQVLNITIRPAPVMTSTNTAAICSGGVVNIPLTSNIASSYTWIAANNLSTTGESTTLQSTSTLNNTITNNTSSIQLVTYSVTPTSTAGACAGATQTVMVTVKPAPIMTSNNSTTICSGSAVGFSFASDIASTYSWIATENLNTIGESTTTQNTSTLTDVINNTTTSIQTVTYTVTPTSTAGACTGSGQVVNVTVNPAPAMTSGNAPTICSGQALSLTFTSNLPSGYSWIAANNVNTTGESTTIQNTSTLNDAIINNTASVQIVTYTVTPTSTAHGCVGADQIINVTVNPAPGMTSTNTVNICSGGTVNISLSSSVVSSYSWIAADNPNTIGESTTPQSSGTLSNTITNNTASVQNVIYIVTPTSIAGGCPGSPQTITVTIVSPPTMTSNNSPTICSGSSVNLIFASDVLSTYSWIATDNSNTMGESTGSQSSGTLNDIIINNTTSVQTVTYTVIPTSTTGGCLGTAQIVIVTVNPAPVMTSANSGIVCSGSAVNIPLTSNVASNYSWIAANNPSTTGESLTVQSTSTINDVITNNTASIQTVTYTVTPTSTIGGCAGVAQVVNVTVVSQPTMTSSNVQTICSGGAVSLAFTSDITSSYSWIATDNTNTTGESTIVQNTATLNDVIINNTASVQTITYTVIPTSTMGGCVGTPQVINVTVNPGPAMTSSNVKTVCSGIAVNILLTSDVASSYSWIAANNTNTTGESTTIQNANTLNDVIINNTSSVQTVTYTVIPVSTIGGCVGNPQLVSVTINPAPVMTSVNSGTICNGGIISISLTSDLASNYTWIATDNVNTTGESTTLQNTTTLNNIITNNTAFVQTVTYTVTPTSITDGCVGTPQVINITVNPGPTMTSSNVQTICSGGAVSLVFTSDIGSSYSWIATDNGNTTGESTIVQNTTTLNDVIVNNTSSLQTVTYTVTPTSTIGGCVGTPQIINIAVNPAPLMTSSNSDVICSGLAVNIPFTSDIASTYSWITTNNVNTTGESTSAQNTGTLNDVIFNNTSSVQTVTYTVIPTSTVGSCTGAGQTVTVTVNPPPTMTSSSTGTICSGGTISISLTSDLASNYTWIATDNINTTGESITLQNTNTLSDVITNNTTSIQTVTYTVIPTSVADGCVGASQIVNVTIVSSPTMTSSNAQTICSGTAVGLILTSDISSAYSWIATDNVNTTGESTSAQNAGTITDVIINTTTSDQTVTYTVTPTSSSGGCVSSEQVVNITVKPAPTMTSSNSAVICSGATLSISLTSDLVATYAWIATDNVNTVGESTTVQTTNTLTDIITNNTASIQTVTYTVIPTSTLDGCAGVDQIVNVTVVSSPTMTSSSSSTISSGSAVNLAFTSDIGSTYSWIATDNINTAGESITNQSSNTLNDLITNNIESIQTVTYTVTPTSSLGSCVGSDQIVNITIVSPPSMTSTNAQTICSGEAVNIVFSSGVPSSYSWIAADNINTIGESTTIQSSGTLNDIITNNTALVQMVTYTVTAISTNGGFPGSDQVVTITINPAPTMTNGNSGTICSGNSITILLTSDLASDYIWIAADNVNTTGESTILQTTNTLNDIITNSTISTQTVTYTVIPTSTADGCVGASQLIDVTVVSEPTITSTNSQTICSGDIVNLAFTSDIGSTYSWIATDNINTTGESISAQNSTTLNDIITNNISSLQTVTYTVTPTSIAGSCLGSDQIVNISVNPSPIITSSASQTICSGASVNMTFTSDNISDFIWLATDNINTTGESASLQSSGTLTDVIINTSSSVQTVTYTLTATSIPEGCVGTPQLINITVNPLPIITSANSLTICSGNTINLVFTADNTSNYSWLATDNVNTTGESTSAQSSGTLTDVIINTTSSVQTITYTLTPTSTPEGCLGVEQIIDVAINPDAAISLTSAVGSDSQTVCVNIAITPITYSLSGGATGASISPSLPSGLSGIFSSGVYTISGTPLSSGTYNYTLTTTGSCLQTFTVGTITVNPDAAITLTSVVGSDSQTVCVNSAITPITYSLSGGATGASISPSLPSGLSGIFSSGVYTISGTAISSGTYNYTLTTTGSCVQTFTVGTITVNPDAAITLTSVVGSDSQTVCMNTAITPITYSLSGGVTGASINPSLPSGLSGIFSSGVYTISGTAISSGTYDYTLTTTGSCVQTFTVGTITVNPDAAITLTSVVGSDSQTVCVNIAITPITYSLSGGATGASISPSLPSGLSGIFSSGVYTISGTPLSSGTYNYTLTTTGSCLQTFTVGTITVNPDATISLTSAVGSDSQTVCVNSAITAITYSLSGGATGASINPSLPSGLSGIFSSGVYTISGTAISSGTYNYTLTTTGSCVQTFTVGTITVNPDAAITLTSVVGSDSQTVCMNTAITAITYSLSGGATGASINPSLPSGLSGIFSSGVYTISGTPLSSGTYDYTLTTTGSCVQTFTVGTITVNPDAAITLTSVVGSDSQTVCVNIAITPITYSLSGGATGASISPSLPRGLSGIFSSGVYTISGTPLSSGTYNYTLTTTGSCLQTFTVGTITVNPDASISLTSGAGTNNQSICNSNAIAPITYSIAGGGTGVIISPTLASGLFDSFSSGIYTISGTPTSVGTYNYTITTTGICAQTAATVSIIVNPDASIGSVSGSSPLCIGGMDTYITSSVVLGGGIGKWISSDTTIAKVDSITAVVTGIAAGTSNISYNIIGGCGGIDTVSAQQSITINPNMSVGTVNGLSLLCINGTTTYSVNAVVLSGGIGKWSSSDTTIAKVDSLVGLVTGVSSGTCNIVYTVSGGCGPTVSSFQLITINPDASVGLLSGATSLCIGGTTTYTENAVVLSGGAGGWYSSNAGVATIDNLGVVTGVSAGTSIITYSISGGCGGNVISAPQTVTVNPNANVGMVSGATPLCIGQAVTYSVSSVILSGGVGGWHSSNIGVATIDNLGVVTGVSAGSSTITYSISGGCGGNVTSAPQTVTVSPNAGVIAIIGFPASICIGATTTYVPIGEVLSGGTAVWSSENTAIATVDGTGVITGVSTGTCNIVYTITGGCGGDVFVKRMITVLSDASITLTSAFGTDSQIVCINSPITPITYSVSGNAGAPVITPALPIGLSSSFAAGIYTISGIPSISGVSTHTIITTGLCAPDTTVLSFTINPTPVMNSASAKTICSGLSVNLALTTTGVPATFSWIAADNANITGESTTTPSTTTTIDDVLTNNSVAIQTVTYTVIPTSIAGGCVGANQVINIDVNPTPSLSSSLSSFVVCSGIPINYVPTSSTTGATFAWIRLSINGIAEAADTGIGNIAESLNDTTVTPVNVTYTITTTANNCSNSGENLTVTIAPVSTATPASQTICSGVTTSVILTSPVSGTTFDWTVVQTDVTGATNGINNSTINQTLTTTGSSFGTAIYTIIPSAIGCAGIPVTVNVTVNVPVVADAGADALISYGKNTTIGGSPTGPSGSTYVWSPSLDIDDVTLANPTVSPKYKMVYTVVVTNIVNGLGCSSSDNVEVNVTPPIYPVNGFTPNGDGVNDTWDIDFLGGYPNAMVEVFNRWGELVFQSSAGYKTKWNGVYNGGLLPVGTYYYIINLNDQEHTKPYTGPVTIMR